MRNDASAISATRIQRVLPFDDEPPTLPYETPSPRGVVHVRRPPPSASTLRSAEEEPEPAPTVRTPFTEPIQTVPIVVPVPAPPPIAPLRPQVDPAPPRGGRRTVPRDFLVAVVLAVTFSAMLLPVRPWVLGKAASVVQLASTHAKR